MVILDYIWHLCPSATRKKKKAACLNGILQMSSGSFYPRCSLPDYVNEGGGHGGDDRGGRENGSQRPPPPSPPWSKKRAAGTCLVGKSG